MLVLLLLLLLSFDKEIIRFDCLKIFDGVVLSSGFVCRGGTVGGREILLVVCFFDSLCLKNNKGNKFSEGNQIRKFALVLFIYF